MAVDWVVFMPPQCVAWDFVFDCDCLRCVPSVSTGDALTPAHNRWFVNYLVGAQDFAADCRALWAGG